MLISRLFLLDIQGNNVPTLSGAGICAWEDLCS